MARPHASVPPEAIRIEDEVWQEAFTRREPARPRSASRLRAIDGGRVGPAPRPTAPTGRAGASPRDGLTAAAPAAPRRAERPDAPPREGRLAAAPDAPHQPGTALPGRRTVTIHGYGAERNLPWPDGSKRRPARRLHEREGFKPDRVALWAFVLGVLLVLVAVLSAHA